MTTGDDGRKGAWYKTWYDNKIIVVLASIFLFPVGMYGLWKSSAFTTWRELSGIGKLWRVVWVFWTMSIFVSPFISEEPTTITSDVDGIIERNLPANKTPEQLEQERKQEQKRQREKKIKKLFLPDGSSYYVNKAIKETMHDPKSFEHVKTVYVDMDDYLMISTTFRGNNAFGVKVLNTIEARLSMEGQVQLIH